MSALLYRTPRTSLHWSTLTEWLHVAYQLEQRRSGTLNGQRKRFHIEAQPLHLIGACDDAEVLIACRNFLTSRQPSRGQRGNAPHTRLIVAINNRLTGLTALL